MNPTFDQFIQKHIEEYWEKKHWRFLTIDELERFCNPEQYEYWIDYESRVITLEELQDVTEEIAIQTLIHKDDHLYPTKTIPTIPDQEEISDIEIEIPTKLQQDSVKGRKKKQWRYNKPSKKLTD